MEKMKVSRYPVPEKGMHSQLSTEMAKLLMTLINDASIAMNHGDTIAAIDKLQIQLYKEASNWAREYRIATGQEQP